MLATALAVAAATVSSLPTASAESQQQAAPQPSTGAPGGPEAAQVTLRGLGPGQHTITLVTGDRVVLSGDGGVFRLDVQPATRPDGSTPKILREAGPDGVYVLPDDALAAVHAGRLDRELFDVKYLAENGYADDKSGELPVIVQYPSTRPAASARAAADALPASAATLALHSIHGAAVHVTKKQAGAFWASVRGRQQGRGQFGAAALGSGVARVWLDRRVHTTLDQSVPLIGAPQAWAAGHDGTGVKVAVLDTGVDLNHPDLAGKVVESRSFVPDVTSVQDGYGHGTHVASIVTGSGAASGGKYKGVAPGVTLAVGKVLDDHGNGDESWVIAGMEWAATSGAKVVSMSLGGGPTDGTDPMSQAVDDLTAQTGTLFVIAAGNYGVRESVATPGAADAALTVAATDKSDRLAGFSSRGPRLDGALKPDIAAPGQDIVAARAAGTNLGPVVDEYYTLLSGTSMATPHVSGAAAILAQQHPDWTAPQLKAALMSTAKGVGLDVYEVGAGRLDVARASAQQVFATTPNADFGHVETDGGPVTRQVGYTNLTDAPVTLSIATSLSGRDGSVGDAFHADQGTLTVPAGGTASTTVTLDPSGMALGEYGGAVTATADGVALTTPVGVDNQAPKANLTVHVLGRDGAPLTPFAQQTIDVAGPLGWLDGSYLVDDNTTVTRVPDGGTVSVMLWAEWVDEDSHYDVVYLVNPEVSIHGDTEITLDARTASQITFDTPLPAQALNNDTDSYVLRTTTAGDTFGAALQISAPGRMWVTRTQPVTVGRFRFASQWTLGQAEVAMGVVGPHGRILEALHAEALHHWHGFAGDPEALDNNGYPDYRFFTGTQDLPVVDVGQARPEDLAGIDLRGKLALVEVGLSEGLFGPTCAISPDQIRPVREAGAAGFVGFPSPGTNCFIPMNVYKLGGSGEPLGIPIALLSTREGLALRDRLAGQPVTLRVTGTPETPYTYVLKPYEDGQVSASLHYTYGDRQLARVDLDIHASGRTPMTEGQAIWKQDDLWWLGLTTTGLSVSGWAYHGPRTRTEWIGPLDPTVLHRRFVRTMSSPPVDRNIEVYDTPVHLRESWNNVPLTPGPETLPARAYAAIAPDTPVLSLGAASECVVCRQGDTLWPFFAMTQGSGDSRHDQHLNAYYRFAVTMDKDGVPVPPKYQDFVPNFLVDDQPGTYHLHASAPATDVNPATDVTWTFGAGPVDEKNAGVGFLCADAAFGISDRPCYPQPLVYVSYDLGDGLAADNTVPAGRSHVFTVDAYHAQTKGRMPAVAGLKLWSSTDDGKHWVPVPVVHDHDGTYTAVATYPSYADTTGAVSLKVEAWDAAGDRIQQTTLRAFALRDGTVPSNAR